MATAAAVILTLASGLYVRTSQNELFLISHVVLAIFVVIGRCHHLFGWYVEIGLFPHYTSGFEIWLYLAIAVWAFDRLMRVGRVLRNGARRASVTDLGAGYVRVDVPGVHWDPAPGGHVYVHFPTLDRMRPWESHPFSVMPSASAAAVVVDLADEESQRIGGETKSVTLGHASRREDGSHVAAAAGLTLFIKKGAGITRHLAERDGLLTLLDGHYYSNGRVPDILRCDRVLLVAGGIGITGMLPWVHQHPNVKLVWSIAESARCLAEAVDLEAAPERRSGLGPGSSCASWWRARRRQAGTGSASPFRGRGAFATTSGPLWPRLGGKGGRCLRSRLTHIRGDSAIVGTPFVFLST